MHENDISRRQFLGKSAILAGAGLISAHGCRAPQEPQETVNQQAVNQQPVAQKRTATDLVPLGSKGVKICRLGMGTGSAGGDVQRKLGQEGFTKLIRHAYDRGVRFFDTADMYKTHEMLREAIKELPREELWIQTKMMWDHPSVPDKPLEVLDRFRKELGTDYVDSLLIHCATQNNWHEELKRMMDAYSEAQDKKLIRLKGVSCHGLPALTRATEVDWVDVHLARVNPQGKRCDGAFSKWDQPGDVPAFTKELKAMHDKGRGIIGMKIMGNGEFKSPEDREKSVQFAMKCGYVDAVIIGFGSTAELDEAIERINRALA